MTKHLDAMKQAVIDLRSAEQQSIELGAFGLADRLIDLKYRLIRLVEQIEDEIKEGDAA